MISNKLHKNVKILVITKLIHSGPKRFSVKTEKAAMYGFSSLVSSLSLKFKNEMVKLNTMKSATQAKMLPTGLRNWKNTLFPS